MFSHDNYDITPTTYSPDGRIFQVEYAREAIKRGSLACGFKLKDRVILASSQYLESHLVEKDSIEKQFRISKRIATVSSGLMGDARVLVDFIRDKAAEEEKTYGEEPGVAAVVKWALRVFELYTRYDGIRPFGVAMLVGGYDKEGPHLYEIDPSGVGRRVRFWAIGKGSSDVIKTLEESYNESMQEGEIKKLVRKTFSQVYDKTIIDVIRISEKGVERLAVIKIEKKGKKVKRRGDEADEGASKSG